MFICDINAGTNIRISVLFTRRIHIIISRSLRIVVHRRGGVLRNIYNLRSQLAKTKIDGGTDNEKKDDSGNETGAGEGEPEEEPEVVHYDKSKSFFDNISCEAVERSKGLV